MTIKTKNMTMIERIWINLVASEMVFQLFHPDTGAPLHDECVVAIREERHWLHEFSTSEMSQMECGHLRKFLLRWSQRVVTKYSQLRKHLKTNFSLLLG